MTSFWVLAVPLVSCARSVVKDKSVFQASVAAHDIAMKPSAVETRGTPLIQRLPAQQSGSVAAT